MFDWLLELFGTVLRFFYDLTHSYLIAIILFAIVTKILLFPLSIKQHKNTVKQAKLRPKETAIRKKYKGTTDPQMQRKMQEEITELYQKEGFNPMGGCLPLLIQFPLIIAIYNVIRNPLRYICGVSKEGVSAILKAAREVVPKATEIDLVSLLKGENGGKILADAGVSLSDFAHEIPDFTIFGNFDLSVIPSFDKDKLIYLLIPILTGVISFVTTKIIKKLSYQPTPAEGTDGAARTSNLIMDLMMPAMSVWMSFIFPAMLGIYWIFQSILGVVQQLALKAMFPYPKFTEEDYKRAEREMNGKGSKKYKKDSRPAPAPGVYRSLHNIDDDEVYTVPDKNKKSASQAPKLKEDNPDHRKKS